MNRRGYLKPVGIAVAAIGILELGLRTPTAIVFQGVVLGLISALTTAGLILVYRTTRVINFAQTAIGAAGGELTFQLITGTKVPFVIAFPAGLVVATVLGVVFDIVLGRRFFKSPRLVLTVATIAAAGVLASLGRGLVAYILTPFVSKNLSFEDAAGLLSVRDRLPLRGLKFHLGALNVPFGFAEVLAIEVALLGLFLLAVFFRSTRSGVAVRAMAENSDRATLLGISVGALSTTVWGFAGLLSGMSVILTGVVSTPGVAQGVAPAVLLPALAAGVLARMSNLPTAVVAAVGIGVFDQAIAARFTSDTHLIPVVLLIVVGAGLTLQRTTLGRSEVGSAVSWEATEEQRPIPRELLQVNGLRLARYAMAVAAIVAVCLFPFLVTTGSVALGAVVALNAIVALSLVVLTGWAGQVSLGQYGFVAVGAVVGGALTTRYGVPFWFAVPIAAAFTGAFAVLVGLPALRIRGLFLAVVTFAFGIAMSAVLFEKRYFGWLLPSEVKRPTLFFINFEDERSMYFLCVAALVATIVVVVNLRGSRLGRLLIAVRENEANVESAGINVVRAKLIAFALSGGIAGFAGALFAHQQRGLDAGAYEAGKSIEVFLLAVVGGVTSVGGALLGSAFFSITKYFFVGGSGLGLIFGFFRPFLVLIMLYVAPGGLISLVNRVRDGVLRIVAQRRALVVPSLFADYDPEVLERRLIPLLEPTDDAGLAALTTDTDYVLLSELYPERAPATAGAPTRASREAVAIGAAASSAALEDES